MNIARVIAGCAAAVSISCQAGIQGYFDFVHVAGIDSAEGWVCESTDPANTFSYGVIQVWMGERGNGGHQYGPDYTTGGQYRPDVNSAGFCGSYAYSGFYASGWFDNPSTVYVYFKDNSGNYTLLNGSPKSVNGVGYFY